MIGVNNLVAGLVCIIQQLLIDVPGPENVKDIFTNELRTTRLATGRCCKFSKVRT